MFLFYNLNCWQSVVRRVFYRVISSIFPSRAADCSYCSLKFLSRELILSWSPQIYVWLASLSYYFSSSCFLSKTASDSHLATFRSKSYNRRSARPSSRTLILSASSCMCFNSLSLDKIVMFSLDISLAALSISFLSSSV